MNNFRDPRDDGPPFWADLNKQEREAIIQGPWLAGTPAGKIALTYFRGANRNKIIGAVNRSPFKTARRDLPPRATNPARERAPKSQTVIHRVRAPTKVATTEKRPPAPEPEPPTWPDGYDPIAMLPLPLPGVEPCDIMKLPTRGMKAVERCRFMVQGGYCGAPSGDEEWCRGHWPYVYSPDGLARKLADEGKRAKRSARD